MVNILDYLNQYIPEASVGDETEVFPVAFGGDMLTAARARTAQDVRVSSTGKEALRGFTPFPADWHAKVNFMSVSQLACIAFILVVVYDISFCHTVI
jgi:hypothetical protein